MSHMLDVKGRGLVGECAGTAEGGLMASGWRPVSLGATGCPLPNSSVLPFWLESGFLFLAFLTSAQGLGSWLWVGGCCDTLRGAL